MERKHERATDKGIRQVKIYPHPPSEFLPEGGFSADEIRRGLHWLRTDVQCEICGKEQPMAMTGYNGGPCIKCGGKTS